MSTVECTKVMPLHDGVLVTGMNFEEQTTASGLILRSDDGKSEGIKPRWAQVYAIGKEQATIKVGDWILVEHGRWTRGLTVRDSSGEEHFIRRVETSSIMMISDHKPSDVYFGESQQSTTASFDFTKPIY